VKKVTPSYSSASLYGFAVEGLGFFHIPATQTVKQVVPARAALIRVTAGQLTKDSVVTELKRLIPGQWKWVVQQVNGSSFCTISASQAELKRMVEWGPVQSKMQGVSFYIEECKGGNMAKMTMPKVWIQVSGLPTELCNFLVLWGIGTMVGCPREVDMHFVWQNKVGCIQVLVIDPNLIPSTVEVVIDDCLYEATFVV
jgi:hypothetical protein